MALPLDSTKSPSGQEYFVRYTNKVPIGLLVVKEKVRKDLGVAKT